MSIIFDENRKYFCINTNNTSYIMGLAADGILTHIYYGKKISGTGAWGRERNIKRQNVPQGTFIIDSKRGATGHDSNPFIALSGKNADEENGNVLGLNLIYSGDYEVGVESDDDSLRAFIGINSSDFSWTLSPNGSFQTPEAVLVYSSNGFGEMSRTFHKLYRTHLCRGKFRDSRRPILINNWEATYFDFDEEKIVELASKAAECGIELMVLDDGWFGTRNGESGSLGDWTPNYGKLPGGIKRLAEKVNALGMKFGIWMEPEMVSPDSDLYRNHPDWCLHETGKLRSEGRNQCILDLSRKEVCEYVYNSVKNVLSSANISYLKWDMNRNMSEVGSVGFDSKHQSEIKHRYILGLYGILEKLNADFPDVLFEGCSGGGGRFDPGILAYMPQIWTSDDTDAVERLYIQYGTSLVYGSSMMGAHVSAVPNHQTGRTTPFDMRGKVAMCGRFGYELNLLALSDEETQAIKEQVVQYKAIEDIVHKGDLYRLASPFQNDCTAFEYLSPDKSKIILFYFNIKCTPCISPRKIKMSGLDENALYKNTQNGERFSGDVLMNMGLLMERDKDCISQMIIFEKV